MSITVVEINFVVKQKWTMYFLAIPSMVVVNYSIVLNAVVRCPNKLPCVIWTKKKTIKKTIEMSSWNNECFLFNFFFYEKLFRFKKNIGFYHLFYVYKVDTYSSPRSKYGISVFQLLNGVLTHGDKIYYQKQFLLFQRFK